VTDVCTVSLVYILFVPVLTESMKLMLIIFVKPAVWSEAL